MSQVDFQQGDSPAVDRDIGFYNIRSETERKLSSSSYIKLQQFVQIKSSVTRRSLLDFSKESRLLFLCKGSTIFKLKPEDFIFHKLQYNIEDEYHERKLFLKAKQITDLHSFKLYEDIEPFEIKLSPDEKRLACISKQNVLIYNSKEETGPETIKTESNSEFVSFSWHPSDSEKILLAEKKILSIYSQKRKEKIYEIQTGTNEEELSSVAWYVDGEKNEEKVFMFLKNMELIEISPNKNDNTWGQKSKLSLKGGLIAEVLSKPAGSEQENISFNSRMIIARNLILIGMALKDNRVFLQIPFSAKEDGKRTVYYYSFFGIADEQTNEVQDGIFLEYNKDIGIIVSTTSSGDDFDYFSKTKEVHEYFVNLSISDSGKINPLDLYEKKPVETTPVQTIPAATPPQTSSTQASQTQTKIKIIGAKFFNFQTDDGKILNVFAFVYETGELVFFLTGTHAAQGEVLRDWQVKKLNLIAKVDKGPQTEQVVKQSQQQPSSEQTKKQSEEQQTQKIEVKKEIITESKAQEEKQLEQTQQSKTELEKTKEKQYTETEKESEKSKGQTKPEEPKPEEQQAKPEESEESKEQTKPEEPKPEEQQAKPEESAKTERQQVETEEESKKPEEYQTIEESEGEYYIEVEEEPQVSGELKKPTKTEPDNNIVVKILIISFFLILIIALIVSFSSVSRENLLLIILKFVLLIVFYILFVFFYEKIFMKGIQIKSRKPIKEEV
jgi:hypothetical protein